MDLTVCNGGVLWSGKYYHLTAVKPEHRHLITVLWLPTALEIRVFLGYLLLDELRKGT